MLCTGIKGLKAHVAEAHPDGGLCEVKSCQQAFSTKQELLDHGHQPSVTMCAICNISFSSRGSCLRHFRSKHPGDANAVIQQFPETGPATRPASLPPATTSVIMSELPTELVSASVTVPVRTLADGVEAEAEAEELEEME